MDTILAELKNSADSLAGAPDEHVAYNAFFSGVLAYLEEWVDSSMYAFQEVLDSFLPVVQKSLKETCANLLKEEVFLKTRYFSEKFVAPQTMCTRLHAMLHTLYDHGCIIVLTQIVFI